MKIVIKVIKPEIKFFIQNGRQLYSLFSLLFISREQVSKAKNNESDALAINSYTH